MHRRYSQQDQVVPLPTMEGILYIVPHPSLYTSGWTWDSLVSNEHY